jgi:hypothetical protein
MEAKSDGLERRREPSSDPRFATATFSHKWEKEWRRLIQNEFPYFPTAEKVKDSLASFNVGKDVGK